jgi:hypothetical protein
MAGEPAAIFCSGLYAEDKRHKVPVGEIEWLDC